MHKFRIGKFGKFIVMAVGTTACGIAAAHCSSAFNPSAMVEGFSKWDYNWDKREAYSLLKPSKRKSSGGDSEENEANIIKQKEMLKSNAKRHLILIRHGQYNLQGCDESERTLTTLGQQQAYYTGKRLNALGITFSSLVCSDLTRALQTTEIIYKHLGDSQPDLNISNADPLLQEGTPITPDPPSYNWVPDSKIFEDGARIEAAFRKYIHRAEPGQVEDSYEIIVCHSNVIRYFVCRALQLPGNAWLRLTLNNASITCLTIRPNGRVTLRSVGDSGHLPADHLTIT